VEELKASREERKELVLHTPEKRKVGVVELKETKGVFKLTKGLLTFELWVKEAPDKTSGEKEVKGERDQTGFGEEVLKVFTGDTEGREKSKMSSAEKRRQKDGKGKKGRWRMKRKLARGVGTPSGVQMISKKRR